MAVWPYNTAQWRRLRLAKLAETPNCVPCATRGVVRLANTVDHRVSIASGGDPFPALDGLTSMCGPCHSVKTQAMDRRGGRGVAFKGCGIDGLPLDPDHPFTAAPGAPIGLSRRAAERTLPLGMRPSRIPLVIVCGAPGSGKSTYVATHAGPRDLVIDLDVIRSRLAATSIHAEASRYTGRALEERNRLLAGLSTNRRHERAWFIFGGAKPAERRHWADMLGAERVHVMETPEAECIRRIKADPTRRGREEQMAQWVRAWFAAQPAEGIPPEGTRSSRDWIDAPLQITVSSESEEAR